MGTGVSAKKLGLRLACERKESFLRGNFFVVALSRTLTNSLPSLSLSPFTLFVCVCSTSNPKVDAAVKESVKRVCGVHGKVVSSSVYGKVHENVVKGLDSSYLKPVQAES